LTFTYHPFAGAVQRGRFLKTIFGVWFHIAGVITHKILSRLVKGLGGYGL